MKEFPVDFHRVATEEFKKAHQWYEERSAIAAQRFRDGVDLAARSLATRFMSLPLLEESYRWVRVGRFPYTLVARLTQEQVVLVVAVAHTSRDSTFWHSR